MRGDQAPGHGRVAPQPQAGQRVLRDNCVPPAHALRLRGCLGHSLRELSQLRDTALLAQWSGHNNFYFLGLRIMQLFLMTKTPFCTVSISTAGFLLRLVDAHPRGRPSVHVRGHVRSSSVA